MPVRSLSPDSGSQITAAAPRVEKELLQRYPQLRKPEKSHKIYFFVEDGAKADKQFAPADDQWM